MANLTTESLTEVLRRLVDEAPLRTGAIPDSMVHWNEPRMPEFNITRDHMIEVNFND